MRDNDNPVWNDDRVQFPRLLAELHMAGVPTRKQLARVAASMDLDVTDVNELFDRAIEAWEIIKGRTLGPREAQP